MGARRRRGLRAALRGRADPHRRPLRSGRLGSRRRSLGGPFAPLSEYLRPVSPRPGAAGVTSAEGQEDVPPTVQQRERVEVLLVAPRTEVQTARLATVCSAAAEPDDTELVTRVENITGSNGRRDRLVGAAQPVGVLDAHRAATRDDACMHDDPGIDRQHGRPLGCREVESPVPGGIRRQRRHERAQHPRSRAHRPLPSRTHPDRPCGTATGLSRRPGERDIGVR